MEGAGLGRGGMETTDPPQTAQDPVTSIGVLSLSAATLPQILTVGWAPLLAALLVVAASAAVLGPWWSMAIAGPAALVAAGWSLHGVLGAPGAAMTSALRVLGSGLIVSLVVAFFLICALTTVGFIVFAIMVGAGIEFGNEAATQAEIDASMDAFWASNAGGLSRVLLWVSLLIWGLSVARALPFAGASISERRLVVLQAFNRSRGHAVKLLAASLLWFLPTVVFAFGANLALGLSNPIAIGVLFGLVTAQSAALWYGAHTLLKGRTLSDPRSA